MFNDMKRLFILAAFVMMSAAANAQSWGDALKDIATSVADKVTGGKLTELALQGDWNYEGPGVKLASDNILAEAGGAAAAGTIKSKLASAYKIVGIKEGACAFHFADDNTFTATMGSRSLSGTYEFDSSTHAVTLNFASGKLNINLGTLNGFAYISGSKLDLVFPVDKLVGMITALGARISSLSTVCKLLENYDSVMVGFEFSK